MAVLSESRIAALLTPYLNVSAPDALITQIGSYLDLLLHWNTRTNLTAIRDPETLVQRQIGESLFAAQFLPESGSLLDFGSGAGFPGIPMRMYRPGIVAALAESQGKKAAFLREAVRHLGLPAEVWAKRVEEMPADRAFDVVTMRAVDRSETMFAVAAARVAEGGSMLQFVGEGSFPDVEGWVVAAQVEIPLSRGRLLTLVRA